MQWPLFYKEEIPSQEIFSLGEDTSRHVVQVLRMKQGEHLQLTDGKGLLLTAEIVEEDKKGAQVKKISVAHSPKPSRHIRIAISLVKNTSRFEWFLEKATEIGVSAILPMLCERTEKPHFRLDRMKNILVSAMLQSRQSWLPLLQEPARFADIIQNSDAASRYVAHCGEEEKKLLSEQRPVSDSLILIGPEGDFTDKEIAMALENNFLPISLGASRLRTETAGVVACVHLNL